MTDRPPHSVTFYENDHLGNLRAAYTPELSCANDSVPEMAVETSTYTLEHLLDYYPYGRVLREYVNDDGRQKYLTTQHERDQETGLDYRGARYYDSEVARFLSLDPKATSYASWSAYNYVMGDPIQLIDPTGSSCECPHPPCDEPAEILGDQLEGAWNFFTSDKVPTEDKMKAVLPDKLGTLAWQGIEATGVGNVHVEHPVTVGDIPEMKRRACMVWASSW